MRYHILHKDACIPDTVKRIQACYTGETDRGVEAWSDIAGPNDIHILVSYDALSDKDIVYLKLIGHYVKVTHTEAMSGYLNTNAEALL